MINSRIGFDKHIELFDQRRTTPINHCIGPSVNLFQSRSGDKQLLLINYMFQSRLNNLLADGSRMNTYFLSAVSRSNNLRYVEYYHGL